MLSSLDIAPPLRFGSAAIFIPSALQFTGISWFPASAPTLSMPMRPVGCILLRIGFRLGGSCDLLVVLCRARQACLPPRWLERANRYPALHLSNRFALAPPSSCLPHTAL